MVSAAGYVNIVVNDTAANCVVVVVYAPTNVGGPGARSALAIRFATISANVHRALSVEVDPTANMDVDVERALSVTQRATYVTPSRAAFTVLSTPTRVRARSIISAAPPILSAGTSSSSGSKV